MKQQFKLYRRSNGRYYAEDTTTGKQSSLGTRDKAEAQRLLHAKNEAAYQPAFNKQMAKTYFAAGDPRANTRTWQDVMDYLLQSKAGRSPKTRERYESASKDPGFDSIRNLPLIHTTAETLYQVLKDSGKPCTNMFLHRFHSFALKLGWLAWPIIGYNQWPKLRFKERRGVTLEEHQLLVSAEQNEERRAFLELLWHVGAAQFDLVNLKAEDVDWKNHTITYNRQKTGRLATRKVSGGLDGAPGSQQWRNSLARPTAICRGSVRWTTCRVEATAARSVGRVFPPFADRASAPSRCRSNAPDGVSASTARSSENQSVSHVLSSKC